MAVATGSPGAGHLACGHCWACSCSGANWRWAEYLMSPRMDSGNPYFSSQRPRGEGWELIDTDRGDFLGIIESSSCHHGCQRSQVKAKSKNLVVFVVLIFWNDIKRDSATGWIFQVFQWKNWWKMFWILQKFFTEKVSEKFEMFSWLFGLFHIFHLQNEKSGENILSFSLTFSVKNFCNIQNIFHKSFHRKTWNVQPVWIGYLNLGFKSGERESALNSPYYSIRGALRPAHVKETANLR